MKSFKVICLIYLYVAISKFLNQKIQKTISCPIHFFYYIFFNYNGR